MSWSISVKTVGSTTRHNDSRTTVDASSEQLKDFTVQVEPEDVLSSLHKKIEDVTGLKMNQQRLIYRGRLISSGGSGSGSSSGSGYAHNHNNITTNNTPTNSSGGDANGNGTESRNDGGSRLNEVLSDANNSVNNINGKTTATTTEESESRICDVAGLSDGQTIHLVPRLGVNSDHHSNNNNNNNNSNNNTSGEDNREDNSNLASATSEDNGTSLTGGAGLLAALLGLGVSNNSNNDDTEDIETSLAVPRLRSTTTNTRSARRRFPNAHRRNASDPRYPEPCPLEPVRQGLMTLHTMIGNTNTRIDIDKKHKHKHDRKESTQVVSPSPLNFKRKWYRGQWLDCRDTVNQWLEATIVEILTPENILIRTPKNQSSSDPSSSSSSSSNNVKRITQPYIDSAIGVNDYAGRRKLLLEPAEDEDDSKLADLNDDEDLIGYKERDNNESVQLLKIHYNGWPHRWDEWIRSDSERIRPFRTRSRHVPSRHHINPSPQSIFHATPQTHIKSEDDEIDRLELLPELCRVVDSVQELLAGVVRIDGDDTGNDDDDIGSNDVRRSKGEEELNNIPLTNEQQKDLSRAMKDLRPETIEHVLSIVQGENDGGKSMDVADIDVTELAVETQRKLLEFLKPSPGRRMSSENNVLPWNHCPKNRDKDSDGNSSDSDEDDDDNDNVIDRNRENYNLKAKEETKATLQKMDKAKIEALAPLLDRLGRVLIDFAPHVAATADSMPDVAVGCDTLKTKDNEVKETEENVRGEVSASEDRNVLSVDSQLSADDVQREDPPVERTGLLSLRPLWSTNRHASDATPLLSSSNTMNSPETGNNEESTDIDPDYVDFINGFMGAASRNESPHARRNLRRSTSDSLGSSLFSAFLASGGTGGLGNNDDGNDEGGGAGGPRVLRLGGGGGGIGGGGGNGGIDIHIHAIVTGPGGGGMTGIGDLNGLISPTPTTSTARNNNNNATASLSSANIDSLRPTTTGDDDDDDDVGLFSDLYSDRPQTLANNEISIPWDTEIEIQDDEEISSNDNIPHLLSDDEVNNIVGDPSASISSQQNREADEQRPTSRGSASSRRSIGRLFRRALNRRSSNNS